MSNTAQLSVLTFNVWGLYISRDRVARMKAIGDALSTSDFDVITLQELWVDNDFRMLQAKIKSIYPYSHHFQGGIVGAGLAVFSKHPIIQIDFRPYRLNGKPIYISHGDWFAGKGIGHVKLKHPNTEIDLFTTHMIANYHSKKDGMDIYSVHRCMQMVEFCNFISSFNSNDSLMIATGDFNIEEQDQLFSEVFDRGMFLVDKRFSLQSVWKTLTSADKSTFNRHSNSYHKTDKDPECIDYIMYDPSKATVKDVRLYLDERIYGLGKSYSDHTAVIATFLLEDSHIHRSTQTSMLGEFYYNQANAYMRSLEDRQSMLQFLLATSFCTLIALSMYTSSLYGGHCVKMILVSAFLLMTVFLFQYSYLWLSYEINMMKQVSSEWICWINAEGNKFIT